MAQIKVTIDGDVFMDCDYGQWTEEPPEMATLKLRAMRRDEPWYRHIMLILADAAPNGKGFEADVRTRPNGWDLSVTA